MPDSCESQGYFRGLATGLNWLSTSSSPILLFCEYQFFDREPTSLPLYHTLPEVYSWKSNWASERPNSLACQSRILLEMRGDGLSMLKLSLKHVGRGKRTFPVSGT